VVVGIIGIMAAVAIPAIARYIKNYRIQGAAQQVVSELQAARARAIKQNAALGVVVVILDNQTYRTVIEDDMTPPIQQARLALTALVADTAQVGPVRRLPLSCQFSTTGATIKGLRFGSLGQACEPGATPSCPAIDMGANQFVSDGNGGWKLTVVEATTGVKRDIDVGPGGRFTIQ
jgi:type II secretory pathway pseudopilin PulG